MLQFAKNSLFVFVLLFCICIPFPLHFIEHPAFFFEEAFLKFIHFFVAGTAQSIRSDSMEMIFMLIFILVLSSIIAFSFSAYLVSFVNKHFIPVWSYFLAFFLLKYGMDKVFVSQFYAAEPNIQLTRFGNLDDDILFWSTMGRAPSYSIFLGLTELIPACLLFFERTRFLGALLAFFVMLHVVVVDFSFGIEVKTLASSLLFAAIILLLCYRERLFHLFGFEKQLSGFIENHPRSKWINFLSFAVILFFITESLYFPIQKALGLDQFSDEIQDAAAYQFKNLNADEKDTLSTFFSIPGEICFIATHSKSYVVIELKNGKHMDYKCIHNSKKASYYLKELKKTFYLKKNKQKYHLSLENEFSNTMFELEKVRFKH